MNSERNLLSKASHIAGIQFSAKREAIIPPLFSTPVPRENVIAKLTIIAAAVIFKKRALFIVYFDSRFNLG